MTVLFADDAVTLHQGDYRDLLDQLPQADAVVTDPPYGETSLTWDRWVTGWPAHAAQLATTLWCFGSMRMFLDRVGEFTDAGWRFGQDLVREKHNGSGFHADRFKRVHESLTHWYRGAWDQQHRQVPTTADAVARTVRRKTRPTHMGDIDRGAYTSVDGGPRLMRSVIQARSLHGRAIHPTQKPLEVIAAGIEYSVPPRGLVIDLFAGSGAVLEAARMTGRRAIGVEANAEYAQAAARRLGHGVLPLEGGAA